MFDYTSVEVKKYIDVNDGLRRVRNNKILYTKMLKMFLVSDEFTKLKNTLAANDYENAEKAAHTIKGITGNLSLIALFDTSVDLMQQLKVGPADKNTIKEFWDELEETIVYVNKVIELLEKN